MNSFGPELQFCLELTKAHNAITRRFDAELGQGISLQDFLLLSLLNRNQQGRVPLAELALETGLSAAAVARRVIPLEKIGLVKRFAGAGASRLSEVELLPAGRRILSDALPQAEQLSEELFRSGDEAISADFIFASTDMLRKIGKEYSQPNYRWVCVRDHV